MAQIETMEQYLKSHITSQPHKRAYSFEPGGCLDPHTSSSLFESNAEDIKNKKQRSFKILFSTKKALSKHLSQDFVDTLKRHQPTVKAKKYKAGGCLDPPTGEEKCVYQPSTKILKKGSSQQQTKTWDSILSLYKSYATRKSSNDNNFATTDIISNEYLETKNTKNDSFRNSEEIQSIDLEFVKSNENIAVISSTLSLAKTTYTCTEISENIIQQKSNQFNQHINNGRETNIQNNVCTTDESIFLTNEQDTDSENKKDDLVLTGRAYSCIIVETQQMKTLNAENQTVLMKSLDSFDKTNFGGFDITKQRETECYFNSKIHTQEDAESLKKSLNSTTSDWLARKQTFRNPSKVKLTRDDIKFEIKSSTIVSKSTVVVLQDDNLNDKPIMLNFKVSELPRCHSLKDEKIHEVNHELDKQYMVELTSSNYEKTQSASSLIEKKYCENEETFTDGKENQKTKTERVSTDSFEKHKTEMINVYKSGTSGNASLADGNDLPINEDSTKIDGEQLSVTSENTQKLSAISLEMSGSSTELNSCKSDVAKEFLENFTTETKTVKIKEERNKNEIQESFQSKLNLSSCSYENLKLQNGSTIYKSFSLANPQENYNRNVELDARESTQEEDKPNNIMSTSSKLLREHSRPNSSTVHDSSNKKSFNTTSLKDEQEKIVFDPTKDNYNIDSRPNNNKEVISENALLNLKHDKQVDCAIKLELAFHSYIDNNNQQCLKTIDLHSVSDKIIGHVITINSVFDSRAKNMEKVFIDPSNNICLLLNDSQLTNKVEKTVLKTKPVNNRMKEKSGNRRNNVATNESINDTRLQRILVAFYEKVLLPLHMNIFQLKTDIDKLTKQKRAVRYRIYKVKKVQTSDVRLPCKRCKCLEKNSGSAHLCPHTLEDV